MSRVILILQGTCALVYIKELLKILIQRSLYEAQQKDKWLVKIK